MGSIDRNAAREKRKRRLKQKTRGTTERPRLSVFRSSRHLYAQIIDDVAAKTIIDASTLSKEMKSEIHAGKGGNIKSAAIIGEFIAKRALGNGIKRVVFDRNGFLYHGRIKAFADSAREHGLEF